MSDIDRIGIERAMREALDRVSGPGFVHVSFDLDSLDPEVAPGVGTPVRGGLTYREAHLACELIAESGIVGSLEVVEANPILDRENTTALTAVELIASALGQDDSLAARSATPVWRATTAGERPGSRRAEPSVRATNSCQGSARTALADALRSRRESAARASAVEHRATCRESSPTTRRVNRPTQCTGTSSTRLDREARRSRPPLGAAPDRRAGTGRVRRGRADP